jgi:type VI secretion system protein ImpC
VLDGAIVVRPDTESMLNARIAEIDRLLSLQLSEIMHHPDFQKLEGTWRGLKYLMNQTETSTMLKIKVLNVKKNELLKDLQKAPEFDQSALFKKVYEEEFGVFGGGPFGALIGDYEFGRTGQDIELLEKVSQVAAAAHAPFLTAASPEMFNLDSFTQLDAPRDLAKIFETTEYAKWKAFRETEDSRYVGADGAAHAAARAVRQGDRAVEAFDYEEGVDGADHWPLPVGQRGVGAGRARQPGVRALRLVRHDPRRRERRPRGGTAGPQLPHRLGRHRDEVPDGDAHHRSAREGAGGPRLRPARALQGHAERRVLQRAVGAEAEDVRQGRGHGERADLRAAALHLRRLPLRALPEGDDARQDRRLHVAHEMERFLNNWINNYTIANDDAGFELKARHPLKEARIEVVEIPGKPGAYRAVSFLRPHFQLDELNVSLRLVADLPQK